MINRISDFNLRGNNTFRINKRCRQWIEYTDADDLKDLKSLLGEMPYMSIGAGSNLLFVNDYPGALLHSRILDLDMLPGDKPGTVFLRAGSGIEMDELVRQTCEAGLWGLENLSGIPGEVGASAVQNVGAYGTEAKDTIVEVECYDTVTGQYVVIASSDCDYGYRWSMFKHPANKHRYIITFVTYRLTRDYSPVLTYGHLREALKGNEALTPMDVRECILSMRDVKLPDVGKVGSAGSFFKNPVVSQKVADDFLKRVRDMSGEEVDPPQFLTDEGVKLSAAWLIDKAGLKGASVGGASTWVSQPLVIVNESGEATPDDVIALEHLIIDKVKELFGVVLHPEVEHVDVK